VTKERRTRKENHEYERENKVVKRKSIVYYEKVYKIIHDQRVWLTSMGSD